MLKRNLIQAKRMSFLDEVFKFLKDNNISYKIHDKYIKMYIYHPQALNVIAARAKLFIPDFHFCSANSYMLPIKNIEHLRFSLTRCYFPLDEGKRQSDGCLLFGYKMIKSWIEEAYHIYVKLNNLIQPFPRFNEILAISDFNTEEYPIKIVVRDHYIGYESVKVKELFTIELYGYYIRRHYELDAYVNGEPLINRKNIIDLLTPYIKKRININAK